MARVPVTEVFFRNSVPPTLRRNYEVNLFKRGTAEKAKIWTAESGGEEREQPLITDANGRAQTNVGGTPWVEPGHYEFKSTEGTELLPWEAAPGEAAGGAGAVTSVNTLTGAVVLTAASVGADASGAASAAQAASQPLDSDLTAIAALATTAFGREFLTLATEGAARTKLGLGTAATQASSAFATPTEVSTEKSRAETAEALKSSETELETEKSRAETAEGLKLAKASNLSDLASAGTARTNLGLGSAATTASTAYDASGAAAAAQAASQPLDSDLTAIAALATTEYGRSLLTAANAAAARTLIGAQATLGAESIEASMYEALSVGTAALAANAVTAGKLASEAVETAAIKNLNVTAGKLAAEAVEEGKIKNLAVAEGKLATAVKTKLKSAEITPVGFSVVAAAEVRTYRGFYAQVATGQTMKLVGMKYSVGEGTSAKFSIKQNGVAVTEFKEKEATTTAAEVTGKSVTVAAGDRFDLTVETITGTPKDLIVTLWLESTH